MVMFYSYVSLPEANYGQIMVIPCHGNPWLHGIFDDFVHRNQDANPQWIDDHKGSFLVDFPENICLF